MDPQRHQVSLQPRAPEPLTDRHIVDGFACGQPVLDDWIRKRALANQSSGATRTFVVADPAWRVLGYYALAAGAVARRDATATVRRNMPDPLPVLVLARLAVDRGSQGRSLGAALLQDAVHRTAAVSGDAGVRALLVHALDDRARQYYEYFGFQPSPIHPMTLMLRLRAP